MPCEDEAECLRRRPLSEGSGMRFPKATAQAV